MKNNKHNRRYFIKSAGVVLLLPVVFLWDKMVKTESKLAIQKKISLPFNPNKNISFQDDFIVLNQDGQTRVFSSHCTHLGCKINKVKNNRLICPCHGSAFDTHGDAVKGPANRPLKTLPFTIDQSLNRITIEV